jgi:RNA polymerase primary sigma factor
MLTCEMEDERDGGQDARCDLTALQLYLREIQKIPVLSPDEERALGVRVLQGDRTAVDELVRRNLRFVVMVARPYARHGVPLEDLIDEGNIGLIRAAERFDVGRGFRFISYAVWWIRQCILLYLTEKSRLVRLPVSKVQLLSRLTQTSEQLTQLLGREPTAEEIAKRLRIPPSKVEWLRTLPTLAFSVDEPAEGEESEFEIDTLMDAASTSTEAQVAEILRREDIHEALEQLDPRGADIVRRYFGLDGLEPESLEHIGKRYGVTRERVRQLRDRAIWKLRTSPEAELLSEYAAGD